MSSLNSKKNTSAFLFLQKCVWGPRDSIQTICGGEKGSDEKVRGQKNENQNIKKIPGGQILNFKWTKEHFDIIPSISSHKPTHDLSTFPHDRVGAIA